MELISVGDVGKKLKEQTTKLIMKKDVKKTMMDLHFLTLLKIDILVDNNKLMNFFHEETVATIYIWLAGDLKLSKPMTFKRTFRKISKKHIYYSSLVSTEWSSCELMASW